MERGYSVALTGWLLTPYLRRVSWRKRSDFKPCSLAKPSLSVSNSARKARLRAIRRDAFSFFSNDLDCVAVDAVVHELFSGMTSTG
jgi:hypothetical protein